MRLIPNEFSQTQRLRLSQQRSAPPLGLGILLGMAPILLLYWLALGLVILGTVLFRLAR